MDWTYVVGALISLVSIGVGAGINECLARSRDSRHENERLRTRRANVYKEVVDLVAVSTVDAVALGGSEPGREDTLGRLITNVQSASDLAFLHDLPIPVQVAVEKVADAIFTARKASSEADRVATLKALLKGRLDVLVECRSDLRQMKTGDEKAARSSRFGRLLPHRR